MIHPSNIQKITVENDFCTCKMKVDTHKSVGVYFFRSIINLEKM